MRINIKKIRITKASAQWERGAYFEEAVETRISNEEYLKNLTLDDDS